MAFDADVRIRPVSARPLQATLPAMILPHLSALNARRIVLASASPRRREILQNLGLKFETVRGRRWGGRKALPCQARAPPPHHHPRQLSAAPPAPEVAHEESGRNGRAAGQAPVPAWPLPPHLRARAHMHTIPPCWHTHTPRPLPPPHTHTNTHTHTCAQLQVVSTFEEDLSHSSFPAAADYAVETARHKAVDVARICAKKGGDRPVDLIISADTVRLLPTCVCGGGEAFDALTWGSLSGGGEGHTCDIAGRRSWAGTAGGAR